jgi:hypothetical protein
LEDLERRDLANCLYLIYVKWKDWTLFRIHKPPPRANIPPYPHFEKKKENKGKEKKNILSLIISDGHSFPKKIAYLKLHPHSLQSLTDLTNRCVRLSSQGG